tara:strand:+ start:1124 stop:3646 length:2523 start_codon:yes stop_codon:yes gene_type:complete
MSIYNKNMMKPVNKIKMIDFCKDKKIQTMPIRLEFKNKINKKTGEFVLLADGKKKVEKQLKCGGKMNWFKNEENGFAKIKQRWASYENGNPKRFTHFAWDTGGDIKAIDIDCILAENLADGRENPIAKLRDTLPFKASTSKSFGRHLIVEDASLTPLADRLELPIEFGKTKAGKAGVEILNGQWAWSSFDAILERRLSPIVQDLLNLKSLFTQKTQNTQKTQQSNIKKTEVKLKKIQVGSKYSHIYENICVYCVNDNPTDTIQKTAAVIHACHNSGDEKVYDLMLQLLAQGANHDGEAWVRTTWNNSNEKTDKAYLALWRRFNKKKKSKLYLKDLEFTQFAAAEVLTKLVVSDFLITPHEKDEGLYFWKEEQRLWLPVKKDKCVVRRINRRLKEVETIYRQKLNDMKVSLEDSKKDMHALFRSRSSSQAIGAQTLDNLFECSEAVEIDFNQEEHTALLFQFQNGAFNFVTNTLDERTREMHISECLPYDYRPIDTALKEKIKFLEIEFSRILQGEALEAHKLWRASCMLGLPVENFMLNFGPSGGNGKSFLAEAFMSAFKIYADKPAKNLFDKDNDKALSKQFPKYFGKAVRMIFMEEWSGNIDIELFKEVVGAETMDVVPLYKGSVSMKIIFNIEASTNKAPKLGELDPAACRRGLLQKFLSEFRPVGKSFSDQTYDLNEKIHHYRSAGQNRKKDFKDPEWALALFHYYRPSATALAKKAGHVAVFPKYLSEAFEQNMKESAKFTDFFDVCVMMCEATTTYKADVMKNIRTYFGTSKGDNDWSTIKNEFEKRGYKYDCRKDNGKPRDSGYFKKGAFINCKVNLQAALEMHSESEDELGY